MNEKDKMLQYSFYLGALVLFVFAVCYFSTSHIDGRRSEDVGSRISDSQNINTELEKSNQSIQIEVRESVNRLGSAEAELDRAEAAIERSKQILENAKRRTQKTYSEIK